MQIVLLRDGRESIGEAPDPAPEILTLSRYDRDRSVWVHTYWKRTDRMGRRHPTYEYAATRERAEPLNSGGIPYAPPIEGLCL